MCGTSNTSLSKQKNLRPSLCLPEALLTEMKAIKLAFSSKNWQESELSPTPKPKPVTWTAHNRSPSNGAVVLPGAWLAMCRLRAAAAAAWGAATVWEGPGALCFTVLVASIVLSAPGGRTLVAVVETKGKKLSEKWCQ